MAGGGAVGRSPSSDGTSGSAGFTPVVQRTAGAVVHRRRSPARRGAAIDAARAGGIGPSHNHTALKVRTHVKSGVLSPNHIGNRVTTT